MQVLSIELLGPVYTYRLRVRLCQIYIVSIKMDHLTIRMGSKPILSVKQSVSIDTMVTFDGDGDGMQTVRVNRPLQPNGHIIELRCLIDWCL